MSRAQTRDVLPAAHTFLPAWWLRNRHLQTVWGPLFRRGGLPCRRERLELPDGDFVDLDWVDGPAEAPVVVVLHGLEGSARSHYVVGVLRRVRQHGWRGVALNFRSCSGELNRLARFYHSGDTGDLDAVVRALLARDPQTRLGVVGVSLGGNVLLKWLGERGPAAPRAVAGAVAISVPFHLEPCARVLDRGLERRLYTANFMRSMRAKVRAKAAAYPGFVDVAAAMRATTFAAYDRAVTAPLGGFADEVDYWRRASCGPYLKAIDRPALLLNAVDDPFVPPEALPDPSALPPPVRSEFVARGGHAGFIDGRWPWRCDSWAERRAIEFLRERLEERGSVC